jgi:hydroxyacylglutathione hydrolase
MKQWVCTACGYNMIGDFPDVCPFCGAPHNQFLSGEEAEKIYRVISTPINDYIIQLVSVPKLGLEHAAYRIEMEHTAAWIDCPSVFNRTLVPVCKIFFTHPHFMGASNQYRELWNAKVYLHALDADQPLTQSFPVDERFSHDFVIDGLAGYHIGGHTPGYTLYIYQDVLFICDYAFPPGSKMRLNPFGPKTETLQSAERILTIIHNRSLKTVCGYNYICDFIDWVSDFERAVKH